MKKSIGLKKIVSFVMILSIVFCSGVLSSAQALAPADYSKLNKTIATIPDGPNRTNGVYNAEELAAIDAMVASFDMNLSAENQATVDSYRTQLQSAINSLSRDLSKAEATVTVLLDRKIVKQDDIITVTIKIDTNYPVTAAQIPVLYDKTQFTLVDFDSGNSYINFCDGSFKAGSYELNGNAGITTGFDYTSDSEKWSTDEARAQYDYAWFTVSFNSQKNPSNLNLAVPQDEDFATFRLQAKTDIDNAEQSVFISSDWIKTEDNKAGTFNIGFSATVLNRNPLTYVTTGMTYNLVTDSMIPTDSISLNITDAVLTTYESTLQLVASVTPDTAINKKITWSSTDEKVAKVDGNGKVTRVGAGECLINAETPYGQIATCKITVPHECCAELTLIKAKEAECYVSGNELYYACTCGKLYSDSNAENETTLQEVTVSALNHPDDGKLKIYEVSPTHTKDGVAEYWVCGYCSDMFSDEECTQKIDKTVILPALGHDDLTAKEWSAGKETHYKECSCGEKFNEAEHTFVWVTEKEPTCAEQGSKKEVCTVCSYVRNENTTIPTSAHMAAFIEGIEPTCMTTGRTDYYYCDECGKYFSDEACTKEITAEDIILPKAEHDYSTEITPPTSTAQGYTTYTCNKCFCSYVSDFTGPGILVAGTVSTSAFSTDEVTLVLTCKGETVPLQTIVLIGNEAVFSFKNVTKGDYTVTVSKNNHITESFGFSVNDELELTQNFRIYALGDVNRDGEVNLLDYSSVLSHAKKIKKIEEDMFIYADVNEDGRISVSDYALILRHVKKTYSLWK